MELSQNDTLLTAAQAAELLGVRVQRLRNIASQQRARGIELRAPRDQWPDGRSPRYPLSTIEAMKTRREGRS